MAILSCSIPLPTKLGNGFGSSFGGANALLFCPTVMDIRFVRRIRVYHKFMSNIRR